MPTHHSIPDETLYRQIVENYLENESISFTAASLGVSQVKVRKVLLTEGLWSSKTSIRIAHYLEQGLTTAEIAEALSTTVKAVQQYLPYSKGLYHGDNPSNSALNSAEYRNRIRSLQERILKKKNEVCASEGWDEPYNAESAPLPLTHKTESSQSSSKIIDRTNPDFWAHSLTFPQYPGIVCLRELPEGFVDWKKAKCNGEDIIRLHLELRRDIYNPLDYTDDGHSEKRPRYTDYDEETRVLREYGNVRYGETISRDILVPNDIPLYALHYVIQPLFGWQNSHLHRFELPPKQFFNVTDNSAQKWANLVGVLFRSPFMDENDQFWADDYEGGSFKTWLRSKYTGPYLSYCHGEGIWQSTQDMKEIMRRFPLIVNDYSSYQGEEYIYMAYPAEKGTPLGSKDLSEKEKNDSWTKLTRRDVRKFKDCSAEAVLRFFLEEPPNYLLERLPLWCVLALHGRSPQDALADGEEIDDTYKKLMDPDLTDEIKAILSNKMDYPDVQPSPGPSTDVLYYYYDFGDNWSIKITGSMDACDLVEQGRITQKDIDEAMKIIHETYRPVCIAADGLPLVDDVGGVHGYVDFLRSIHPTEEKHYWTGEEMPDNGPYEDKKSSLTWARSLGWKDTVKVKSLL